MNFGSLSKALRCPKNTHLRRNSAGLPCMPLAFSSERLLSTNTSNPYFGKKAYGAFHFGTNEYASCFLGLPRPDPQYFHQAAVEYLNTFDPQEWYDHPMTTVLNGETLTSSNKMETTDAFGTVNGTQLLATPEQIQEIQQFIKRLSQKSTSPDNPHTDLRDAIRQVEETLFTEHSGFLVGNQCIDFGKQDGATEIEEAIMANVVERRLNDLLILDEKRGVLSINRQPIYVSCVSNFSNFLDLSRKTLRSLEVGIPTIILGRSNTSQHAYRWTRLLQQLCAEQGVDPQMITFLSASVDDIKSVLQTCQDSTGNLYTTCSRQLAQEIKTTYPKTIASTGGPNTMIIATPVQDNPVKTVTDFDGSTMTNEQIGAGKDVDSDGKEKEWFSPQMKAAIKTSAAIESAGQCTALRHVIVPPSLLKATPSKNGSEQSNDDEPKSPLDTIFSSPGVQIMESPVDALQKQLFDAVFLHQATPSPPSDEYRADDDNGAFWKVNTDLPQPTQVMPEFWRKVVVDYTPLDTSKDENLEALADWLNHQQPISLAINGNMVDSYKVLTTLFERTALCVYTVGGRDDEAIPTNPWPKDFPPALTCQARPQEGEIFGEVPPRWEMEKYTKYPVLVPTSNPSYDSHFNPDYILSHKDVNPAWSKASVALFNAIESDHIRGYSVLLADYIRNVDDENPKQVPVTSKGRTVLWGLQRPPLQMTTIVRANADSWDTIAPPVLLFHVTNARDQIEVSLAPDHAALKALCDENGLKYRVESATELAARVDADGNKTIFQVTQGPEVPMEEFPMVAQFASLYFPMGHVKSTAPNDQEFLVRMIGISNKWLQSLF